MGEGESRGALGAEIARAPIASDAAGMTLEAAKIHRELAVGNFFVTLRGVAGVAGQLLRLLLEQEQRDAGQ